MSVLPAPSRWILKYCSSTSLRPDSIRSRARHFDDLVKGLRDGLGVTVIMVSHELPSLFGICDDGVFLDAETRTAIARGALHVLRDECSHPTVRAFMHRESIDGLSHSLVSS